MKTLLSTKEIEDAFEQKFKRKAHCKKSNLNAIYLSWFLGPTKEEVAKFLEAKISIGIVCVYNKRSVVNEVKSYLKLFLTKNKSK